MVIGAKTFTEQYILSALTADVVERDTGLATRLVPSLGSTAAFDALRNGTIDAERMRRLNFAVDEQGESPAAVARRALEEMR